MVKNIKKAKGVNKNVLSNNKYKDVLLNKKCLRHSMSTIQSKNHRIGTYGINKISLSRYDDQIYILDNGIDVLALLLELLKIC